ncbi:MAG: heparan-alpha-glucosaminide N-acetyltransferase domain-containing protein [Verrucomicrobia bacterium]|nr:heparan-alpha-glucosaminide N-acetyltransferase domain-containing protein [Verrucomicrobiota bacterium]
MPQTSTTSRLQSLDALRGFDMCWILGLGAVVDALLARFAPESIVTRVIDTQLEHVVWEGSRFYDLIFPLFLFIAGVSMAIALPRRVEKEGRAAAVRHLLERALILVVIGVFFSGGLKEGWAEVRWLGVLQRIGIASAAAGLLSLWLNSRGIAAAVVTLLVGYWLLLRFVPVPGFGAGDFAEGHNLTNYLDSLWLPGRKYDGDHDPEGLLSTLPAIATALLGIFAGKWLKGEAAPLRKVLGLIGAGAVLIALGWCWHPFFPIVKKIWSSSFVLVAGGWSALLLGIFYWIVDVRGWRGWTTPFMWVGANPIALYICAGLGFFRTVSERLAGHPPKDWAWISPCVTFTLLLLVARSLWKRGIFIKV